VSSRSKQSKDRKSSADTAESAFEQVYSLVRTIPPGKVLTYGIVSHLLSGRLSAQGVGWALNALTNDSGSPPVPWQRVVNAKGGLSTHKRPEIPPGLQKHLLELEGVQFDQCEQIELETYLWHEGIAKLSKVATIKRQ
jgi:methylated-DNA-protein-cysteine methyltransferase-like protein